MGHGRNTPLDLGNLKSLELIDLSSYEGLHATLNHGRILLQLVFCRALACIEATRRDMTSEAANNAHNAIQKSSWRLVLDS